MFACYLQVKSSESKPILPGTFDILTNDNNNINVIIWFQGKGWSLEKCIGTARFKNLLDEFCENNQKQPHEILTHQGKNNHLFLPPILAIFVASYLSPKLHYNILKYYLHSRMDQIESVYKTTIDFLEQKLLISELGLKLNRGLFWVDFEAPFAYY